MTVSAARPAALAPLYGAGFVTAFGAHAVAASAGVGEERLPLVTLGIVLAVYDGAEVLLKPVFGGLADRIGPRPVLLGGLAAFAAVSLGYVAVALTRALDPAAALVLARLGQGAAASAFSPAAGALVGRLAGSGTGRVFGSYGAWKGLGYTTGPLVGGVVLVVADLTVLIGGLAALAVAVVVWAALAVPRVDPLPRRRQTVVDLARRLAAPGFLRPTAALAGATAALSAGVGFLPVLGARAGLPPIATGAVVAVLAVASTLVQPRIGHAHDRGALPVRRALAIGFALLVGGFALAAAVPGLPGLVPAALLVGAGVGIVTPVGFAAVAASSPPERLGQTMGSAEVGRELGDAGGPLLVAGLAAATTVATGMGGLAAVLALLGLATTLRPRRTDRPE